MSNKSNIVIHLKYMLMQLFLSHGETIISTPSKLPVARLFGTGLSWPVAPWILAVMIDPILSNTDFLLTASKSGTSSGFSSGLHKPSPKAL